MGQKVNPISLRLEKTNRHFDSCWYDDYNYTDLLLQDLKIKNIFKNVLDQIKYPEQRILIEMSPKKSNINLFYYNPTNSRRKQNIKFHLPCFTKIKKNTNRLLKGYGDAPKQVFPSRDNTSTSNDKVTYLIAEGNLVSLPTAIREGDVTVTTVMKDKKAFIITLGENQKRYENSLLLPRTFSGHPTKNKNRVRDNTVTYFNKFLLPLPKKDDSGFILGQQKRRQVYSLKSWKPIPNLVSLLSRVRKDERTPLLDAQKNHIPQKHLLSLNKAGIGYDTGFIGERPVTGVVNSLVSFPKSSPIVFFSLRERSSFRYKNYAPYLYLLSRNLRDTKYGGSHLLWKTLPLLERCPIPYKGIRGCASSMRSLAAHSHFPGIFESAVIFSGRVREKHLRSVPRFYIRFLLAQFYCNLRDTNHLITLQPHTTCYPLEGVPGTKADTNSTRLNYSPNKRYKRYKRGRINPLNLIQLWARKESSQSPSRDKDTKTSGEKGCVSLPLPFIQPFKRYQRESPVSQSVERVSPSERDRSVNNLRLFFSFFEKRIDKAIDGKAKKILFDNKKLPTSDLIFTAKNNIRDTRDTNFLSLIPQRIKKDINSDLYLPQRPSSNTVPQVNDYTFQRKNLPFKDSNPSHLEFIDFSKNNINPHPKKARQQGKEGRVCGKERDTPSLIPFPNLTTANCLPPFYALKFFYKMQLEYNLSKSYNTSINLEFFRSLTEKQGAFFYVQEIIHYLERKVPFRKIKAQVFKSIPNYKKIKGIRITCSGRVGGRSKKAQRSKTQSVKLGQTSLGVFSSKIDFACKSAYTRFGLIGVKVWICYQ